MSTAPPAEPTPAALVETFGNLTVITLPSECGTCGTLGFHVWCRNCMTAVCDNPECDCFCEYCEVCDWALPDCECR